VPLASTNHLDGARRVADHRLSHAANEQALQSRMPMRSENDEISIPLTRLVDDNGPWIALVHSRFHHDVRFPQEIRRA
jgi:hypothetical protein